MKHTIDELRQWQALPLSLKIRMTEERIRMWIRQYDESGVYVSFSGGKDSTVLLDIVRNRMGYKEVPAVFVDTGLEYPEIREFVKTFENVVWLKPKMNFKKVIEKYGYPFISKEVSHKFDDMYSAHAHGHESYADRQLDGTYISRYGKPNFISVKKWKFIKEAPFKISHRCCNVMKKEPLKTYTKIENRVPMTAEMASESALRRQTWLKNGCNVYDEKKPKSTPMAFWTEEDVLQYIKENSLEICSVYGDIIQEGDILKTTGCQRTGCMYCGFGCHLHNDQRFVKMKETHPKQYEWIMKKWEEGGLGYKDVIDWLNENGKLNIKY